MFHPVRSQDHSPNLVFRAPFSSAGIWLVNWSNCGIICLYTLIIYE